MPFAHVASATYSMLAANDNSPQHLYEPRSATLHRRRSLLVTLCPFHLNSPCVTSNLFTALPNRATAHAARWV